MGATPQRRIFSAAAPPVLTPGLIGARSATIASTRQPRVVETTGLVRFRQLMYTVAVPTSKTARCATTAAPAQERCRRGCPDGERHGQTICGSTSKRECLHHGVWQGPFRTPIQLNPALVNVCLGCTKTQRTHLHSAGAHKGAPWSAYSLRGPRRHPTRATPASLERAPLATATGSQAHPPTASEHLQEIRREVQSKLRHGIPICIGAHHQSPHVLGLTNGLSAHNKSEQWDSSSNHVTSCPRRASATVQAHSEGPATTETP